MKFRLLAGIIFLVVVLIHVYLVFPHLNLESQIVNFISIFILFVIGSVLGIFGRKLDETSNRKGRL